MYYRGTCVCFMRVAGVLLLLTGILADEGKEILEAIQESRRKSHLPPLTHSRRLTSVARERTEALLGSFNLFNKDADIESLARARGSQTVSIGENIGRSKNISKNGMDIFKEWINSSIHRENIMDPSEYTHIGVYRLKGETSLYVSAVFARFKEPSQAPQDPRKKEGSSLSITSTRHLFPSEKDHLNASSPMNTQLPKRESKEIPPEKKNQSNNGNTQSNSLNGPSNQRNPSNPQESPIKGSPGNYQMNASSGSSPGERSSPESISGNPNLISSSAGDSSTFLLALPEHLQRPNSVLKLILVPEVTR